MLILLLEFTDFLNSRIKLKFSNMLNAFFAQTTSSQTSVNIAVQQIVARQLNDTGIVQETTHELAPALVLTSQISHTHAQADIKDFLPSNSSMPAIIAENHTSSTLFGFLKRFIGHIILFPRLLVFC